MHIILSRRRQNKNRKEIAMSSLLFYAIILQIFAHGLNAQLLTEKIPLGKSFLCVYLKEYYKQKSYHITLPFHFYCVWPFSSLVFKHSSWVNLIFFYSLFLQLYDVFCFSSRVWLLLFFVFLAMSFLLSSVSRNVCFFFTPQISYFYYVVRFTLFSFIFWFFA